MPPRLRKAGEGLGYDVGRTWSRSDEQRAHSPRQDDGYSAGSSGYGYSPTPQGTPPRHSDYGARSQEPDQYWGTPFAEPEPEPEDPYRGPLPTHYSPEARRSPPMER
eukprot:COSAG02_NODE_37183_length_445_cov_0.884393_1_plen_106_part_01